MAIEPLDTTACGERFLRLASELLREVRDPSGLVRALAGFATAAEEEVRAGGERPVACMSGCPYCCVLNVAVLLPEAAVIAYRLSEGISAAARTALIARLDRQRRLVRWMEDGERVRRQICCPFLDEAGSCAIHQFRPLVCRGVTSVDSALCREALDPTELDVPYAVPMDLVRKMVMDEAFRALAKALAGRGMETRSCEVGEGVWIFLARPELCERLFAGRLPSGLWE